MVLDLYAQPLETGILEVSSESWYICNYKHTEVKPGQILKFNLDNQNNIPKENLNQYKFTNLILPNTIKGGKCIFEYIYFLSPNTFGIICIN